MKKLISLLFVLGLLVTPPAEASSIRKISKGRALVAADAGEFRVNDVVYFFDDSGERMGSGRVYRVKGRKVYVRKTSGEMRRGYMVSTSDRESSGGFDFSKPFSGPESGVIALGGFALLDVYGDSPFVFGADYAFARARNMGLGFRAGFTYWSVSEDTIFGSFKVSSTSISGAAEYLYTVNRMQLSAGLRFGYNLVSLTVPFAGLGIDGLEDDTLFLSPFATAAYPLGPKMSIGGEFRSPYYFSGGSFLGDYYLLGSFMYKF